MLVYQLAEGDAHHFLDDARALDRARDLEKLGALVIRAPEACEPRRAAAQDRRDDRDAFDIVHRRRTAIKPRARRERRFQARLALLALEALDHRGFFAADIGAGAAVDEDVEVVARFRGILAEQTGVIRFLPPREERPGLADELAAAVDLGGTRAHREARDPGAFNQLVRIVADD